METLEENPYQSPGAKLPAPQAERTRAPLRDTLARVSMALALAMFWLDVFVRFAPSDRWRGFALASAFSALAVGAERVRLAMLGVFMALWFGWQAWLAMPK
jgi:hypothetical protein